MEISELTIKLILLLIPGAIASLIFEKLTLHRKWTAFKFIAHSVLFGGLSYLLAQWILNPSNNDSSLTRFWQNLPSGEIPFQAIKKAFIMSVLVGFVASGAEHYKIVNRVGKILRLTNKYGDENLYSYFLNAKNVSEVYVRDIKNNLTYHGMINSFAEKGELIELLLRDVGVYQYETSEFLYEIDKIYLSMSRADIVIELPFINKP